MAQASIMPLPRVQFFNSNGAPLAGGKVYTYSPGTSTLKASYTDSTAATPNANPVILDSAGTAAIWLSGYYKINVTDSNGVQISGYPVDNVSSMPNTTLTQSEWVAQNFTFTYISATQFSTPGDVTPTFQVNRRIQAVVAAGTIYGTITAASYGSGVTTVTVSLDSGNLDSGLSAVSLGILAANNLSVPLSLVIPSFYQDTLKTKLMTVPNVASDTLALLAATQTFTGVKTFTGNLTQSTGTVTGFPGRLLNYQVLNTGTVYTPTTGTGSIVIWVLGAGGGGGSASVTGGIAGGGGGGSYAMKRFTGITGTYSYAIGAGGVAGTSGGAGGLGGTTSFTGPAGLVITAPGGGGGQGTGVSGANYGGAGGGLPGNGDVNCIGMPGGNGFSGLFALGGAGGGAPYGGGGAGVTGGAGNNGTGIGGGGGGSVSSGNGGTGAAGGLVIYEYS